MRICVLVASFCLQMLVGIASVSAQVGPSTHPAASQPSQAGEPMAFPKIDRKPAVSSYGFIRERVLRAVPKYDPASRDPFQYDLRHRDLSNLDLREAGDVLSHGSFDGGTVWPVRGKMPQGFYPRQVMEMGKDPGLGVRQLHKQGITGKGVGIAIIDQPLLVDHQEYCEQLRLYEEIHINAQRNNMAQMHGPAVASIAVGKTVGVAPEADLYFIAEQHGDYDIATKTFTWDFQYLAQSVDRILQINEQLPADRKIHVISMSVSWDSSQQGYQQICEAVDRAKAAGMLVLSCTPAYHPDADGMRVLGLGRAFTSNPNDYAAWRLSAFMAGVPVQRLNGCLLVPEDARTTACPSGAKEYVFYGAGGLSWTVPYVAGVYALAVQVDPKITPERFQALAMLTGRMVEQEQDGRKVQLGAIVDPVRLIVAVKGKNPAMEVRVQKEIAAAKEKRTLRGSEKVAFTDLPAKVAQVNINRARREDILRVFGQPTSYKRGGKTLKESELPDAYRMQYPGHFSVDMVNGSVNELRFDGPSNYVFRDAIRVGSSLDDVLKVLPVARTVQGQKNEFASGTLYKDIDGRKGAHYYAHPDQGIRLFFWNDTVSALYLTATQSQDEARTEPGAVAAHQHVEQHEPRPAQDMVALAKKAGAMVQAIAGGRFEEAQAAFSPAMRRAISAEQLAAMWRQLQEVGGAFQGIDHGRVGQHDQATIVSIPTRWLHKQVEFQVVYDSRGQVTGLWTTPPAASQPEPMADLRSRGSGSPRGGPWSSETGRSAWAVDRSYAIIQFLREGQAGLAPQFFDEQLQRDLSVLQLRDMWAELERVGGELLEAGQTRTQALGENTAVYIPLHWRRNSAEMKLVFNADDRAIALAVLPAVAAQPNLPPVATQPILLTDRAKLLVQNLVDGQYEKVRGEFDVWMERAVPATELRRVWEQLSQASGKLQSIGEPRVEQVEQSTLVYVPVRWQQGAVEVKIVYDKMSHVSGLVIVPLRVEEPAASQPAAQTMDRVLRGMVPRELGTDPDRQRQFRLTRAMVEPARTWLQNGRSEDAAKCDAAMEQLLSDPRVGRETSVLFAAARIAWLRNNPEKAIVILRQVVKDARPGDRAPGLQMSAKTAALLSLGTIQRHSGRLAEARGTYESLLPKEVRLPEQLAIHYTCHLYLAELDKAGHRNDQAISHLDAIMATKAAASRPAGTAGYAEQMAPWQRWAEHQKVLLTHRPDAADASIQSNLREADSFPLLGAAHLALIGVVAMDWPDDDEVFNDAMLRRTIDVCPRGSLDHDLAVYTIGISLWNDVRRGQAGAIRDAQEWFRRGYDSESYFAMLAGLMLAHCQAQAGQADQARATLEKMKRRYPALKVNFEDITGLDGRM